MTIQVIPVTQDPAQIFTCDLGNVRCVFDLQFNDRSGLYSLTLTNDVTGQIYFQGVPLVLGVDLLEPYNYDLGYLAVFDSTKKGIEATPNNFGITSFLIWASADEPTATI